MRLTTRLTAAVALGMSAFALAACGGGSSDEDKITDIVVSVGKDPAKLCDHMAASVDKAIGGKDGCLKAAKADGATDPDIKVDSVTVDGDTATAKVSGSNTNTDSIKFVKEDGDWKVAG
jgi:hypothetical protein